MLPGIPMTGLLSIGLISTGQPSTGRLSTRVRQISMPLVMRTSSTMLPSKQQCNLPSLPSHPSPLLRLLRNEIQNPQKFDLVFTVLFQIFPSNNRLVPTAASNTLVRAFSLFLFCCDQEDSGRTSMGWSRNDLDCGGDANDGS